MNLRKTSAYVATASIGAVLLSGCGARVEGTYSGANTGFLDSITLRSGGKVNVQGMGMTKQGTYRVEGDEVTITVAGDTQVLRIDERGCLVGGGLLGSYCKDANQPRQEREQRLAGIFEAGDGRDAIRLEFQGDGVVQMTMREDGRPGESATGRYELDGNRVRIAVADSPGLELVRSGDTLEGKVGYATLRFEKR